MTLVHKNRVTGELYTRTRVFSPSESFVLYRNLKTGKVFREGETPVLNKSNFITVVQ